MRKVIHLCFVTKYYGVPKNGPSTFAYNFIKFLMKKKNYRITVISGEDSDSKFGEKVITYKSSKNLLDGLKIRKLIKKINKEEGIDILYFNCYRNAIFSHDLNIPYFININDHHSFIGKGKKISRLLYFPVFSKSRKNFVNSQFTLKSISSSFKNIHINQFLVTGKGIIIDDFEFYFKPIKNNEVNILFVGSQFYRKGLDILIDGINYLKIFKTYKIQVNVVGDSVDDITKYFNLLQKYDLENNIRFLGRKNREEIKELHRKSHIFILPSREEAFGVSIIEALASGTTVIASNTGGIPSIIDNNEDGLLIDVGNKKQLAEKIEQLVENKYLREKLTYNGLKKAKKFDFYNIFNEIECYLLETK